MERSEEQTFLAYLQAKKEIDDRALNRRVWGRLVKEISPISNDHMIDIIELGAGYGAMSARILEAGFIPFARVTLVDQAEAGLQVARSYFQRQADLSGYQFTVERPDQFALKKTTSQWEIQLRVQDVHSFLTNAGPAGRVDLVLAHAFLDLVDLSAILPLIMTALKPNGIFYFSINFDGLTAFEPEFKRQKEARLLAAYHQTMDRRQRNGRPSGHSQTGRRLFHAISQAGGHVLEAGSSDWVVFPKNGRYTSGEEFFLHFIIEMIENELGDAPEVDLDFLREWGQVRHQQIEAGKLVYIAHQMDFIGGVSPLSHSTIPPA